MAKFDLPENCESPTSINKVIFEFIKQSNAKYIEEGNVIIPQDEQIVNLIQNKQSCLGKLLSAQYMMLL